jgi:hypothetical protein
MPQQVKAQAATLADGNQVGTNLIEVKHGYSNGENTGMETDAASYDVGYDHHVYTRY